MIDVKYTKKYVLDRYLDGKLMAMGYECTAYSLEEAKNKAIANFTHYGHFHKMEDFKERK